MHCSRYKIVFISSTLFLSFITPFVSASDLRILNWEEYLSQSVKEQWQQQSSIGIEEIFFDNDEKRDAILIDAKDHGIDIAIVDEIIAEQFGKEGLLLELGEQKIPSLKHVGDFWRARCGKYAVPYFWGTFGIAYRSDKITTPPSSWADLLKPNPAFKQHVGMLDDHTDMLAPTLFYMGHSINTSDEEVLKNSFEMLKQQIPYVLTYDYAISYLKSGKQPDHLYMAPVYSGDHYSLNEIAGKEELWKYVVPQEGSILWVDCLAIPATSTKQNIAIAFIEYLNQPKVAAKNAYDIYFATPNEAALRFLPADFLEDTEIFPDYSLIERSELYKPMSNENIELRLRITSAIKKIHESQ